MQTWYYSQLMRVKTFQIKDLSLLGFILNARVAPLVIVVNKWDGLDQDVKDRVKSELDRRLGFIDFARVHLFLLYGGGVGIF